MAWLAALAVLLTAPVLCSARDITVGGTNGWSLGVTYDDVAAAPGDVLVFTWTRGFHNVLAMADATCNLAYGAELAGLNVGQLRLPLNKTGTLNFACGVVGHCESGMRLTVRVAAVGPSAAPSAQPPAAAAAAPGGAAARRVAEGSCSPPLLLNATTGLTRVECLGPPISLAPGQVVNEVYHLANPYPLDRAVAVVNQTSEIVDARNRSVPLSEVYVHHFIGDLRFVLAEGAELRGSFTRRPLPDGYALTVNGSDYADVFSRSLNFHLINTVGVSNASLAQCIECWCPGSGSPPARGGVACCSRASCPTNSTAPAQDYFLKYTVAYRDLTDAYQPEPVSPYILDAAGGRIEYQVPALGPNRTSIRTFITRVDAGCRQSANFSLVSCVAHQHIGGRCMRMYNNATGELLCESCPVYGTDPGMAPGNETGYLVKMLDDDLIPAYPMAPGTVVRLESEYDASTLHLGVMGFMTLALADWDEGCQAAGPTVFSGMGLNLNAGAEVAVLAAGSL